MGMPDFLKFASRIHFTMTKSSTTEISIVLGTIADADELSHFGEKAFRDTYASENEPERMQQYVIESFSPSRVATELSDTKNRYFVARNESGRIVGYAKLVESEPEPCVGKKAIEIERIYVDSGEKGKGIGGKMMQRCIDEAGKAGFPVLWLGVWIKNEPAVSFYKKWGFEIAGTHVFVLGGDEQTDWVMSRAV